MPNPNSEYEYTYSATQELTETPTEYVDYTPAKAVRLALKIKNEYFAPTLTKNTIVKESNLVGTNGEFTIIVQTGYYDAGVGNLFYVEQSEEITLDKWIEYSTGKQLNAAGTAWENGGVAENGFFVLLSDGDQDGITTEGIHTFSFSVVAKVEGGYVQASVSVDVRVATNWYTDNLGGAIELKSWSVYAPIYAVADGENHLVAESGDMLLIPTSTSDTNALAMVTANVDNFMTPVFDRFTGEAHHFLNGVEIFGAVRSPHYTINSVTTYYPGEVLLFNDYIPPVDGESNIEVKFPCYVAGNSDKIDKCRIGKLFGNSNAKNRLFVSGNPDFPNCDWHTSARNSYLDPSANDNGDFTYFGDMDYCFYGQTDNAIMGYDNVATDKMVVLKSKSKVEPTNYFRTSTLIQAIDASGNAVKSVDGSALYQESFPLATGNIGAGMMNINALANLNGDTLYISSENTVCGLDIAGQVGDSQRISYSRSRYIDLELKEQDLSNAVLWTDNTSLFLFAPNATYMTHYETFNSETNQYEWFKLDVKGVRCAIDIDGDIYFGNAEGELYKFEKDCFEDKHKLFVSVGGTLYAQDKITYNSAINSSLGDGTNLTFKPLAVTPQTSLYRKVASINEEIADYDPVDLQINYVHNTLDIVAYNGDGYGGRDDERALVLMEELAYSGYFYLDKLDGEQSIDVHIGTLSPNAATDFAYYNKYKLVPAADRAWAYKLLDEDGNELNLEGLTSANLCRVLDGEYEITDLDKTNCTFKIRENGRVVDVVLYAEQDMSNLSFPSEIIYTEPVESYFIAAPAILGDLGYRKTIWAWSISAFREKNDLQVCQVTNEVNLEKMKPIGFADNVPIGFDLGGLDFIELDLGKYTVPRKYTYIRPISVPFISFGFKSDKPENSTLTATSIIYTMPMLGKGNK